ncbi:MAG: hypothetical protein A2029_03415 [Chloroflexi bacterium RBG_19FT_COMBO_47_9]|nr:MAG: hypothetical protein A2Y53_07540 [Chloroflexi bacterium RBG_16_47_49]OGO63247.1 MAG: hypothetical protein A2029_03415 [Chloroflexi bacterium RBG_19FT_COMBO_47_9]
MSTYQNDNRFSVYAVWQTLNRALLEDVKANQHSFNSYRSPTIVSCMTDMSIIGEAIKSNDTKTACHHLSCIASHSRDAIEVSKRYHLHETDEFDKPFYEFNMAAHILMVRITGIGFLS